METKGWYFVRNVSSEDAAAFQVQVLDDQGRAVREATFGEDDDVPVGVPVAVAEAARKQSPGQGDYVDATGRTVPPF